MNARRHRKAELRGVRRSRSGRTFARAGFTLIEILVATSLGVVTITAGALLFQAVTVNNNRPVSLVNVTLGTLAAQNFYGLDQNAISVYSAPNYGRSAFAEEMREIFLDDVSNATAVFCLARNQLNTVRPTSIPYPAGTQLRLDTPEGFRAQLIAEYPDAATIFTDALGYRMVPTATNGSIFILQPSATADALSVRAIYEIDLVTNSDPAGTYASVRRYEGNSLSYYYDIFYPQGTGTLFRPLWVLFEREERRSVNEGSAVDRFKIAKNYPFYLIWWPDPAAPSLEGTVLATYSANDPRQAYGHMGGRTAFMFTTPLFPAF